MTTDPAERAAIVANVKTLTTLGQANAYVQSVTTKARALRDAQRTPAPPA